MTLLITASFLAALSIHPGPSAYQLNREGRELLDQHRYPAAVRIFRQAVDLAESEIGPNDPRTAMILRNLALAYVDTGDFEAAERSAHRAFSIVTAQFGPAESGLTPILNVLAECYASSGRIAKAQRMSEQAIAIGPSAGAHYGIALHNLGAIRELSGDEQGAASWYRKAIAAKSDALGTAHPSVVVSKTALRRVQRHDYRAAGPIKLEQSGE
jgi:tetratricopeptide (TPR) repeat protein